MRFLTRSLAAILILCLTAGLLALAGANFYRSIEARNAEDARRRPPEERVYAVNAETVTLGPAVPVITAYGEVAAVRTLEVRTAVGGTIVELAEGFRDGGVVAEGEVLVRIDPADAEADRDLAQATLREATEELREATAAEALAREDLAAAEAQRELRAQAAARQRDLLARGAGTTAAVETAELALSGAEQTLVGRRQALAQAEARINRAKIALDRARIALGEAERALADTTITAPFGGLMTETGAVLGRRVGANEQLGSLIDTGTLEVAFRVSNAQYARLVGDGGRLLPVGIEATLPLDGFSFAVSGTLDRSGAEVGEGQTGRLLYARLEGPGTASLRPGDFLTVTIAEPELQGVAILPASAVSAEGELLLIGAGDRLEAVQVTILRRQGNLVIVEGAPEGREYAAERLPQLGAGVKVRPVRPGEEPETAETMTLDPERRARLVAAVEANTRMPAEVRDRMLARLREAEVPTEMVERIEARMSGAPGGTPGAETASAETLVLDPERKARLIAFVEANTRMPEDVKARILAQLNADAVPAETVERLESRMGG